MEQLQMMLRPVRRVPVLLREGMTLIDSATEEIAPAALDAAWGDVCKELNGGRNEAGYYTRLMLGDEKIPRGGILFARDADGTLISTAALQLLGEGRANLHMVGTLPRAKGRGAATAVCAAVVCRAAEYGAEYMTLKTDDFRLPAIAVYRRLGFRPVLAASPDARERWQKIAGVLGLREIEVWNEAGEPETIPAIPAPKKAVRIGILGGARGSSYVRPLAALPDVEVTVICEARPELREQLRAQFGGSVAVVADFEEMIKIGVDAVVLANYFPDHARCAIRAMEAGVDVVSETTAAPTPDECLALLEAVERTGRRYMLAANCPSMLGPAEMTRRYRSGELGDVLYAEAEYLHRLEGDDAEAAARRYYPTPTHWRRFIPSTYYNMHTLGVLLAVTGLRPLRVTAMEIETKPFADSVPLKTNKTAGGVALYEMENGAIFRSTGWCDMGPDGKWFRLSCMNGTLETVRTNQDRLLWRRNGAAPVEYEPENPYTAEEQKYGHSGADAGICRRIRDYLVDGREPDFDVYRAVTLSLCGIYAFYSILDGRAYDIPDVHDRAARECLRGDTRSPFPAPDGAITLPTSRRARGV